MFSPHLEATRGMLATLLYRLEGSVPMEKSPFKDVAPKAYYSEAVAWAKQAGIVNGYSQELFGPEDAITREDLAVILMRYAAYKGYDVASGADLTPFSDSDKVSQYAEDALAWAIAKAYITGKGNHLLAPDEKATRGELAVKIGRAHV